MDRKDNRDTNPPCHSAPSKPSPMDFLCHITRTEDPRNDENKYEKQPTLNLLIKIKRREKLLNEQILTDQAVYEDKLFNSRRMSDLQKYLKSLRKSKHFPDEMYYNVAQNGQETKKTTTTDSEKCNLFNDFFDVFTKDGKINEPSVYPKQRLNYLRI